MTLRSLLLALCLAAALLPVAGQDGGQWPFQVLGPDQGLPSGGITSVAQDRDGFLWFGTENGLIRYDGRRGRRWTVADGLVSAYVGSLEATPDGALWVAGLHGLVRFKDGRFEPARLPASAAGQGVSILAADDRGRVWAFGSHRIFRQQEGLDFVVFASSPEPNVYSLARGRGGVMYLAGSRGVHALHPDGHVQSWGPESGLPKEGATLVGEDGQGRLWAGSGHHLSCRPAGALRFEDRSALLPARLSPIGSSFLDPSDGSLWAPTLQGVLHLSGSEGRHLGAAEGLPLKWVRSVFRDREGTLWLLGASLARLRGGGLVRNFALGRQALGEMVWWIARRRDGTRVVGTDDGAALMTPKGLVQIPGTEGIRIKSVAEDPQGVLWMVSTRGPTLWLRPGRTRAEVAPLGPLGWPANVVWTDPSGTLWIGHATQGILRWDPKARALVQEVSPAFVDRPTLGGFGIQVQPDGVVWASSSAGLLRRDTSGTWRRYGPKEGLPDFPMRGLALAQDGSLWVHFQEGMGLMRIRVDGDRLAILDHLQRGKGLRTDVIYALALDSAGSLWVTTDQGVDRISPALHIGRQEGMASEDCSVLALRVEEEAVWAGTSAGLARLDRTLPLPGSEAPQARILAAAYGGHLLESPTSLGRPLTHQESTVTFQVAAPSYARSQDLRFQVRLQGFEDAWRDLEGSEVRYPALPGGAYRFEVRARLGDLTGPEASLAFRVRPPWWRTWWAEGLGALAILGLGFAILRIRLAALARAKADLEAQIASRTRELQDRNQELSRALSDVKQLSGLLPICACCKKIRDDRGYWNQLEVYISAHSEADFTHGICPECARSYFPEARHRHDPAPGEDPS